MCLAIPGTITAIEKKDALLRMGKVDFGGLTKKISLCFTPEAQIGDWVLVHAGFAISQINATDAKALIDKLREAPS